MSDRNRQLYDLLGEHFVAVFKEGRKQLDGKGEIVTMPPSSSDCKAAIDYMKMDPAKFNLTTEDQLTETLRKMAQQKGGPLPPVDTEGDDAATE